MADLKLKDLRYLVAVADERHFGRAARKSFVSQPTLSAQLRKLEDYLGVRLIERQPRRVSLTEAGEKVVARARRILQDSDEIVSMARHSSDPLSGTLRRSRSSPPSVRICCRAWRHVYARRCRVSSCCCSSIRRPCCSNACRPGRSTWEYSRCRWNSPVSSRACFSMSRFLSLCNPDNPLAGHKALKPADLDGQTLLLLEDGHCLRDQALEVCARVHVQESGDYRATSLETLRQMVAAGHGITLLPEMALHGPYGDARSLVVRPFAKPVPKRQIGAVWRRSSTRMPAIQAVCDTIANVRR